MRQDLAIDGENSPAPACRGTYEMTEAKVDETNKPVLADAGSHQSAG
jgi:hypothetical protein